MRGRESKDSRHGDNVRKRTKEEINLIYNNKINRSINNPAGCDREQRHL